jgi:hypothetical protein
MKVVSRAKHSSLFGLLIIDEEKSLVTLAPAVNVSKLFSLSPERGKKARVFITVKSLCNQA